MLRTNNCGELRMAHIGAQATLCGWVQTIRDKGGIIWIDLRDRYGVTQLILEEGKTDEKTLSDLGDKSGLNNSGGDYFYSRLYLSLYREAKGDAEGSKQFMKDAVASYYGKTSNDYMTAVARVHLTSR